MGIVNIVLDFFPKTSYAILANTSQRGSVMLIYLQLLETEGDRAAFEQLYRQYRELMYQVARKILRNGQDAEDAVHQAFLSILEHFEKLSRMERLQIRAFCVIVAERKALDIIRRRARYADSYDAEGLGMEIPLPGDSGLADAMAALPARYREALLLRFYFGYSPREMAGFFQTRHAAVKKLIWRAKCALAEQMEKGEDDHGGV